MAHLEGRLVMCPPSEWPTEMPPEKDGWRGYIKKYRPPATSRAMFGMDERTWSVVLESEPDEEHAYGWPRIRDIIVLEGVEQRADIVADRRARDGHAHARMPAVQVRAPDLHARISWRPSASLGRLWAGFAVLFVVWGGFVAWRCRSRPGAA